MLGVGVLLVAGLVLLGPTGTAQVPIRLYVFDGGVLQSDPARYQLTKEDVGTTELAVAAYLIVHPRGVLMWDAGAVSDSEWTPTGQSSEQRLFLHDKQERRVTLTATLTQQLASTAHTAASVTHLALSHAHWDHAANAGLFANATWLTRQAERDAMFSGSPAGTSRPQTFEPLRTAKTVIVTNPEYDVFGDGAVVMKSAPGHTPGHQVLYVKLARTGGVVLSGDLYHYAQERTMDRYPVSELDQARTRVSRKDVEAFLTKTRAALWIQHDLTAHRKLKKAPAYYD
jgi:N-acyl homoserine lactone hydrolase